MNGELLTQEIAQRRLNLSAEDFQRAVNDGMLTPHRLGTSVLYSANEVESLREAFSIRLQ